MKKVIDMMVDRFLAWKLPQDFSPDCGIAFDRNVNGGERDPESHWWPIGTNLFTAEQARKMFEQVMPVSKKLLEHSGCGHGTQVEQLTVRLNPGDKVVLLMGPYSAAMAKNQSPD